MNLNARFCCVHELQMYLHFYLIFYMIFWMLIEADVERLSSLCETMSGRAAPEERWGILELFMLEKVITSISTLLL